MQTIQERLMEVCDTAIHLRQFPASPGGDPDGAAAWRRTGRDRLVGRGDRARRGRRDRHRRHRGDQAHHHCQQHPDALGTSTPLADRRTADACRSRRASADPDYSVIPSSQGTWPSARARRRRTGRVRRADPRVLLGRAPCGPVRSLVTRQPPRPGGGRARSQHRCRLRVHAGGGHQLLRTSSSPRRVPTR